MSGEGDFRAGGRGLHSVLERWAGIRWDDRWPLAIAPGGSEAVGGTQSWPVVPALGLMSPSNEPPQADVSIGPHSWPNRLLDGQPRSAPTIGLVRLTGTVP